MTSYSITPIAVHRMHEYIAKGRKGGTFLPSPMLAMAILSRYYLVFGLQSSAVNLDLSFVT